MHHSQSEHSDRPRHGAATAACFGIRSINDALLNRDNEMSQSEVVNANNDNRVNGMSVMRAQRVDALSVNALLSRRNCSRQI